MKLIPTSTVLDALNRDSTDDNKSAAGAAIEVATSALEARLNTSFQRASTIDTFIITNTRKVGKGYFSSMVLGNGFIVGAPSLTSDVSVDLFGEASNVDLTNIVVNAEKGIITETATDLAEKFVQVNYTYGFAKLANTDVYEGVPDWLKSACLCLSLVTMKNIQPQGDDASKIDAKAMILQFENIMGQHIRYAPGAALPI